MASALLEAEDCNVISVDWGRGSLPPYTQAAANIRLVALEATGMLEWLRVRVAGLRGCRVAGSEGIFLFRGITDWSRKTFI